MRHPRAALALLAAVAGAALGAPAPAHAIVDLTAFQTRIGDHPAYVRVVVDFTDGVMGTNDAEAVDPDPFNGSAAVDVRHTRVQAQAPVASAHGVTVRVLQATNRIRIRLAMTAGRFKYVDVFQLRNPERVVIDLYKSRPPSAAAEIRAAPDRCLTLGSWTVRAGRIAARGMARNLFENTFSLVVRNASGRVVGRRIVTVAGRSWARTVRYAVGRRQAGTLEAVAGSARDGSLDCLAQVRVTLRP
ncbi:MAG TPA: Gmad2 immunoglobulin-like domain-containing protein [Solirubrobacteraceae bacterium]|nr:Gmad2 immunoglobulin-like domain-containing protein [Solirubrobacteraceae bacterium]